MATLIIRREPAFKRGMQSIEILADGRKAGTLWNSRSCRIDIAAGRHIILAKKSGAGGRPLEISTAEGETRHLVLNDTDNATGFVGLMVFTIMITSLPDGLLGGLLMLWLKLAFFAIEVPVLAYIVRRRAREKLTITEDQANLPAASAGAIA
jgi:hypothetical protein